MFIAVQFVRNSFHWNVYQLQEDGSMLFKAVGHLEDVLAVLLVEETKGWGEPSEEHLQDERVQKIMERGHLVYVLQDMDEAAVRLRDKMRKLGL